MHQIEGGWRVEERRNGAARLILKSATGAEVYMDLSPDDLDEMRARLDALLPAKPKASAPLAKPKPDTGAKAAPASD
jgi:hypothetical protein